MGMWRAPTFSSRTEKVRAQSSKRVVSLKNRSISVFAINGRLWIITSQENHSVFQDLATLPPIKLASNLKLKKNSLSSVYITEKST
jgi:hypothetical protein